MKLNYVNLLKPAKTRSCQSISVPEVSKETHRQEHCVSLTGVTDTMHVDNAGQSACFGLTKYKHEAFLYCGKELPM
jgi:hypothetical protein